MSNVGGVCDKKTMTIGKGEGRRRRREWGNSAGTWDGKRYVQRSFLFSYTILCSSCENVRMGKNGILIILKLDGVYI